MSTHTLFDAYARIQLYTILHWTRAELNLVSFGAAFSTTNAKSEKWKKNYTIYCYEIGNVPKSHIRYSSFFTFFFVFYCLCMCVNRPILLLYVSCITMCKRFFHFGFLCTNFFFVFLFVFLFICCMIVTVKAA